VQRHENDFYTFAAVARSILIPVCALNRQQQAGKQHSSTLGLRIRVCAWLESGQAGLWGLGCGGYGDGGGKLRHSSVTGRGGVRLRD
jgi:hypothetical protein